jgi:translation initiation factor 2 beta subunit (eIF-2beta)/eIF-5
MSEPDYVICMECETPVYTFEWRDERVCGALCPTCGNDDPSQFMTEEELEEMSGAGPEEEDEEP